ncbi:hypothetical protein OCK74_13075 [Chitinophagaceae bacterium LB-8]|uniref:Hemerythrin domain-containing protein n=1 Tax=Paraflavisolibacter caeni TaxID=2982496 RepID=A0A9X2XWX9_9BACT|nr:hypothetical protein [Paraflavisolibacter caeni]MCU7550052.1 hypothetical protein [Paraflavisolibacter caeni]
MANTLKPIKRSASLRPLSREHHDGLLFCWKIRQGIKKEVTPRRMANFCLWAWTNHFASHFKKEEDELLQIVSAHHPMMEKMLEEHEGIQFKIELIQKRPEYEGLERLVRILDLHIRFEERVLFPFIETIASASQLEAIGAHLQDEKGNANEIYHDEFWLEK